ncbi:hypothetical protein Pcinc_018530 [Petrolisthes cinctipes]|uniref:Uncharacterized protein n=1 Tax=Petrolisthes cinctipes TaxID=88211 RepID=A0AAE1FM09_PETCI|nr:hypothetical protein Pcinc_018530 [Petrolisthes cinctipes]
MWVGTALSEPNGLCRIKLLLRDFDSSFEWELEPVHPKKKKPILPAPLVLDLGELDAIEHPPMSQDAPMLQVQASSTQSMSTPSSIGIDEELYIAFCYFLLELLRASTARGGHYESPPQQHHETDPQPPTTTVTLASTRTR